MIYKIVFFFILWFSFCFSLSVFADEAFTDDKKTIKQLQNEVKEIQENQKHINNKLHELLKNSKLRHIVRTDLTPGEIRDFEGKVKKYLDFKDKQSKEIVSSSDIETKEEIKKNILVQKKKFYTSIVTYIQINKHKEYQSFIHDELQYENTKNTLQVSKEKANTLINKKVEIIQDKIQEHNNKTDKVFNQLVEKKLTEKLSALEESSRFKSLVTKKKILILDKVLTRLSGKKQLLEKKLDDEGFYYDDVTNKKLEIYTVGKRKLKELKNKYLQKSNR